MSKLSERVLLAIGGMISLILAFFFINKTKNKEQVLISGDIRDAIVSDFGTKGVGGSKTMYVILGDKEYYIGSYMGKYKNAGIGDTVQVYYKEGISDVVIFGRDNFTFEYYSFIFLGCFGVICLLTAAFIREKRIRYVRRNNYSKGKINKSKLSLILRDYIPNKEKYDRYDEESILLIDKGIVDLYENYTDLLLLYIDDGLRYKDFRVTVIFNSVLKYERFYEDDFVKYFRKILRYYISTSDLYYHCLINGFILSSGSELVKNKDELKRLLENCSSQDTLQSDRIKESIELLDEQ